MNRMIYSLLIASALLFFVAGSVAQGFLHAEGKLIYDGAGQEVLLRGIGTGNWMLNEGYMMKSADFAGTHTQYRTKLEQTIGEANTEIFYETWLDNHFTRCDADSMKAWGFNSVRVAMHYKWFTLPIEDEPVTGQDTWFEEGFVRIDSLLDWCGDNQMYLILDIHGAPGGQGHDRNISDYDPAYPSLWESAENRRKLTALWKRLAERYAGEPWIGGYDLINEPNWDLPNGTLLKQTYVNLTNAIRQVDQNHMIIIEGNWFANDYTGLTPPWDDNMVYSFHKYWNYNTQDAIQWMINIRNAHNVPIWLGETGENSNSWFTDLIKLAEANKIGWSWWPVKKAGINNVLMVPDSPQYNNLLSYWQYGTPSMTADQAYSAVMDWADKHRIENCTVQRDVIDAMIRQPHSNATLPFKNQDILTPINMVNYDLGKCSSAYWDTDTANYHLNTGSYTNWNQGWTYRNDGVDIQVCSDNHPAGNGFNIAWTLDKEWLQYTVNSDTAAAYQVLFRTACQSGPSIVHLEVNGVDVCPQVQLPVTGGWQTWMSTTIDNVIIPAGTSKIRFYFDKGGSNVNLFRFINPKPVSAAPFEFISASTDSEGAYITLTLNKPVTNFGAVPADFNVKLDGVNAEISAVVLNPGNTRQIFINLLNPAAFGQNITLSYSGNSISSNEQVLASFSEKPVTNNLAKRFVLPATIQAEDFNVNSGYQLENCNDAGGGVHVGFANNGDYLDYNIYIPVAGEYTFRFRIATIYSTASISIRLGEGGTFTTVRSINFSNTGGWQAWTTQSFTVTLPQGNRTLRFNSLNSEYNINWFEIAMPADVNEIPNLKRFSIYPNPNSGLFWVEAEFSRNTQATVAIYDLLGVERIRYRPDETLFLTQMIDYQDCTPGIYILSLSTEWGELSRKVVIN